MACAPGGEDELAALREVERVARMAMAYGGNVLRKGGPMEVILERLDKVRDGVKAPDQEA